jgi:hypothetical protein
MQFGFEDLEGTTSGLGYEPLYEQDRQHAEDDEHEEGIGDVERSHKHRERQFDHEVR